MSARFFNTGGPCRAEHHYMLPAAERLPEVRRLVDRQNYFVVHAPRQSGKTTTLIALAEALTREGRYAAVVLSVERGASFEDDIGGAEDAVLGSWQDRARDALPPELQPPAWSAAPQGARIGAALRAWAVACPRPLVVFLDEIDSLKDRVLLSVLRQIRDGHNGRPQGFPWSLALFGLRDVRDYKIASGGSPELNTGSPFNIAVRSLTLVNFTEAEIATLYAQHTADTGQRFDRAAVARVFALTGGQPWLVNSLARIAVDELAPEANTVIDQSLIDRARDVLIARQETHFDSLLDRLRDPRVRAVIEPMLAGSGVGTLAPDDIRFVLDLGLVSQSDDGRLAIANPIYRELIARELTATTRASLPALKPVWLGDDGRIRLDALLTAFLSFWRLHGEPLLGTSAYSEIAPHIVLMAFLQRVVNGGGTVDREFAIGRGRMDLLVRHRDVTLAVELKTWRDSDRKRDVVAEGLAQLDEYLAAVDADSAWLVLFDQRTGQPPIAERTSSETTVTPGGRPVTLVRA